MPTRIRSREAGEWSEQEIAWYEALETQEERDAFAATLLEEEPIAIGVQHDPVSILGELIHAEMTADGNTVYSADMDPLAKYDTADEAARLSKKQRIQQVRTALTNADFTPQQADRLVRLAKLIRRMILAEVRDMHLDAIDDIDET